MDTGQVEGEKPQHVAVTHVAVASACYPLRSQAFRHLYTLATQPRCLEAIDVDSGQSVHVPLAISTDLTPQQATAQQATDPRATSGTSQGAVGTQRAAADAPGIGTAAATAAQGTGAHLGAVQAPEAGVAQGAMVTVTPCLLPERGLVSREMPDCGSASGLAVAKPCLALSYTPASHASSRTAGPTRATHFTCCPAYLQT